MLSATSRPVRIATRRIARQTASVAAVAPAPNRSLLGRHDSFNLNLNNARAFSSTRSLGYATTTNPNPPFGKKNASNDAPSRIALIGGRGYTGQALIELLDKHPQMDLRYVSSRELAGQELQGYTKRKIIYENLSADEYAQLDVDAFVLALPNGIAKPYVDAIDQAQKGKAKQSVILDLSADYRFDDAWTYGLPELTKRSQLAQSTRISNPGCYATAAQLSIAPLLDHIEGTPTIFGTSGYSGAGTKKSLKNDVEYLTGGILPCADFPQPPILTIWISVINHRRLAYWPPPRTRGDSALRKDSFLHPARLKLVPRHPSHHQHPAQQDHELSRHPKPIPREVCG